MRDIERMMENVRDLQIEIDEMCTEIKLMQDQATKISQTISDMPKSQTSGSKIENSVVNLVYSWQQLEHEIERINLTRNLIKQDIKSLILNKRMQAVLIFRYLYNSSWSKIAKTLHISLGQVHKDKRTSRISGRQKLCCC